MGAGTGAGGGGEGHFHRKFVPPLCIHSRQRRERRHSLGFIGVKEDSFAPPNPQSRSGFGPFKGLFVCGLLSLLCGSKHREPATKASVESVSV